MLPMLVETSVRFGRKDKTALTIRTGSSGWFTLFCLAHNVSRSQPGQNLSLSVAAADRSFCVARNERGVYTRRCRCTMRQVLFLRFLGPGSVEQSLNALVTLPSGNIGRLRICMYGKPIDFYVLYLPLSWVSETSSSRTRGAP